MNYDKHLKPLFERMEDKSYSEFLEGENRRTVRCHFKHDMSPEKFAATFKITSMVWRMRRNNKWCSSRTWRAINMAAKKHRALVSWE